MGKTYVVKPGDYVPRLAFSWGVTETDIWDASGNKELSDKRNNYNILLPEEDVISVPASVRSTKSLQGGSDNPFSNTSATPKLRVSFFDKGEPIANTELEAMCGNETYYDQTDGNGRVEIPIAFHVQDVLVAFPTLQLAFRLRVANLYPMRESGRSLVEDRTGARQRLANLGYGLPPPRGELATALQAMIDPDVAMEAFYHSVDAYRATHGSLSSSTDDLDEDTAEAIEEEYGC